MFCSDGLTDLITSKQIISILDQDLSLKGKVQALVDAANNAGGKDNVTVVLVECKFDEQENGKERQTNQNKVQHHEETPSYTEDVIEKGHEEQVQSTNDMKKTNPWIIVAMVIVALLSCASFLYTSKVYLQVKQLRSDFDNHLLYSSFQNDSIPVIEDSPIEDSIQNCIMQTQEMQ